MPRTHASPEFAGGSLGFVAGSMRNNSEQKARARSGKPIPYGERPAERPMADQLGNGRNYAEGKDGQLEREVRPDSITSVFARTASPTYWRRTVGLKLWSWEQG